MILDKNGCRPFDETARDLPLEKVQLMLSWESEKAVKAQNKKVLAALTGYGNANDAYHQTASSPEGTGAYLAMEKALKISG